MIQVRIVVAGAMGELALSMFPELHGQILATTRLTVPDQVTAARVLAQLAEAGIEALRVEELRVDDLCLPAPRTTRTG